MKVDPNYSSMEVLQFTYDCVKEILDNNIEGDLVECGVASGNQLGAMQECLIVNNQIRTIYGYDSYKGIPYATDKDDEQAGIGEIDRTKLGLLESTGITVHGKESVYYNFNRWGFATENLILVEGWFEETVPVSNHNKIALLRLDGDLYKSTKVCLQHLLSKVSKGGIVIIDDWQLTGCRKAVLEFVKLKDIIEIHGIAYFKKK